MLTYTVYHIPNRRKVGLCKDLEARMQRYEDVEGIRPDYCEVLEILPRSIGDQAAGDREQWWRAKLGYPPDTHYVLTMQANRSRSINSGKVWINNGKINKRIKSKSTLPDGWYFGRLYTPPENFPSSSASSSWITNGIISRRLLPEERMPDGWEFGRRIPAKNFCQCGCGREIGRGSIWARGHAIRREEHQEAIRRARLTNHRK